MFTQTDKCELLLLVLRCLGGCEGPDLAMGHGDPPPQSSCHTDISDPSNQQIQTDTGRNPLPCSGHQSYTHRRDAAALVIGYWLPH